MVDALQIPLQIDAKIDEALRAVDKLVSDAQTSLRKLSQGATRVNVDTSAAVKAVEQLADGYSDAQTQLNSTISTQKKALAAIAASGGAGSDEFKALVQSVKAAEAELQKMEGAAKEVDAALGGVQKSGKGAFEFNQITQAATQIASTFASLSDPFVQYEKGLAEIQAITGVSGDALQGLGDRAKELALAFGGDVTSQLDSFKGVLSRLGADVAKDPAALGSLANSINTLAAAGGIDAAASMDALTNSLLQFGLVDESNPAKTAENAKNVIDQLAKSAQVGAAEIPQVAEAVVVAGSAAKNANVSFSETNAALQVLAAKSGQYGSQAGTSLRNVIGLLQKNSGEAEKLTASLGIPFEKLGQALTTQGLDGALTILRDGINKLGTDAEKNAALMQIFGTENAGAASSLLNNLDTLKDFTAQINDSTGTAGQQANIVLNTVSGQFERLQAAVKVGLTEAFSTLGTGVTFALKGISEIAPTISTIAAGKDLLPDGFFESALGKFKDFGSKAVGLIGNLPFGGAITNALGSLSGTVSTALGGIANGASKLAAVAFGPWGLAIAGITAALVLLYQNFEPFRKLVDGIANAVTEKFSAIANTVSNVAQVFGGGLTGAFEALTKGDFGGIGKAFQQGVDKAGKEVDVQEAKKSIEAALNDANGINANIKANADTSKLITDFEAAKKSADTLRLKFEAATQAGDTKSAAKFKEELIAAEKQTQKLAQSIGEKIPGALKETENGYTVNTNLARNFVNVQSTAFAQDKTNAQKKFTDGLKVQGDEYKRLQDELKKVSDTIASGKANAATIKQFDELQTKVKASGDGIKKALEDAGKAGLLTSQGVADIAKSFGIPLAEAKKLAEELSKPVQKEVRLDAKKLAEDLDKALSTLGESRTLNVKAATQSTLNIEQLENEYKQLEQAIRKEKDTTKKAELQGKLDSIKRELDANKAAQAEARETARKADKEQDKIQRAQDREEFSASSKARRQANLDKLKADAEQEAAEQRLRLNAIANERERAREELKIKFDLEKKKIDLEKTSGTLGVAEQLKVPERLQSLEKQRIEETTKLEIQFLRQDVERRIKAKQEEQKISIDTNKAIIETTTKLDFEAAQKRADARESLLRLETGSQVAESIRSLSAFAAQRDKIFAGAVDASTGKILDKDVTVLENRLNTAANEIQSAFERFIQGTDIDEIPLKSLGFPDQRTFELEARKYEVRLRDFQAKQATLEQQNAAELLKVRLQSTNDLAQLSQKEQGILTSALEATGQVRLQGVISNSEREFAIRAVQAKSLYDRERELAGTNAQALAEAELKFRVEAAQALTDLRIRQASSSLEAESIARVNELEKQFQQELTMFADNEARKLDIERQFGLQRLALLQEEMRQRAGVVRLGVSAEQQIYETLFSALSSIQNRFDTTRNDFETQKANLKKQKEEELRVTNARGKERLEILKKYREEEKKLDRQFTGGAAALAQLRDVTSEVLGNFAAASQAAFQKATVNAKGFADVGSEAFLNLGATAVATFGQVVASGGDVGKALGKVAFDALQALVPIIVAQITGFSLAQPDAVASFGATAAARVALLTAILQGAISIARAAAGFRKGGYTGDGKPDDEAGIVHKGEFVHTYETTRNNREVFEFLHKGRTLDEYVEKVLIPRKPSLAERGLQMAANSRAKETVLQNIVQVQMQNGELVRAIEKQTSAFEQRLVGVEEAMRYAGREFRSKQAIQLEVVPNNERYIQDIQTRSARAALG